MITSVTGETRRSGNPRYRLHRRLPSGRRKEEQEPPRRHPRRRCWPSEGGGEWNTPHRTPLHHAGARTTPETPPVGGSRAPERGGRKKKI